MHPDDFFRQLANGELAQGAAAPPRAGPRAPVDRADAAPVDDAAANGKAPAPDPLVHSLEARPAEVGARPRRHGRGKRRDRKAIVAEPTAGAPSPAWRRRLLAVGGLTLPLLALPALLHAGGPANTGAARDQTGLALRWEKGTSSAMRTVWRPGATATIAGALKAPDGRRLARATISVMAADADRPQRGSQTVGEVRTDGRGRFAAAIAVDLGAARKLLTFTYVPPGQTAPSARAQARLEVTSPITAASSTSRLRRGKSLTLSGMAAPGAGVTLLIKEAERRNWRRLVNVDADRDGRWQGAIRISRDSAAGVYAFRARVAGSARRGYLAAASRPVRVKLT